MPFFGEVAVAQLTNSGYLLLAIIVGLQLLYHMQGKKKYQERLFVSFQLSDHVPEDNFYRRLKDLIDFIFLYKRTSAYYGKEGQKSIDPVVFMKLMLVGYLENINSDRRIISTAKMRLDVLYFLGYNLDEELPWHSTLSRTRQLYGQEIFTEVFQKVLKQCIDKGMVAGKRQAVDSVLVKANASLDSIVKREVLEDVATFSRELDEEQQKEQEEEQQQRKKESNGKQQDQQKTRVAVVSLTQKLRRKEGILLKTNGKNKTHCSSSDPDAKISFKPNKPTALNYLGQVSVDTASHVITHIGAFKADQRDCQCLPSVVEGLLDNLGQNGMQVEEIIADSNYSSGEALKALEHHNITGYIPNRGQLVFERPGFTYNSEKDCFTCPNNEELIYKGTYEILPGAYNKEYKLSKKKCNVCPLNSECTVFGKQGAIIRETVDKGYYQRMQERMQTKRAKRLMNVRQSTVEPVIGTLVGYLGMKKVYTKGLEQADKCVTLSATAYNIKKLLKYKPMLRLSKAAQMQRVLKMAFDVGLTALKLLFRSNPHYSIAN